MLDNLSIESIQFANALQELLSNFKFGSRNDK